MFHGLLKRKFYAKCKSSLKMTKTRLEALKKKKNAVIKYLRNDMAELLKTGMDYNAYCRADGLIAEENLIACYNFIEQFCSCIASNLSLMGKQKECPDECKEAVQSLIYATARFSEFPELRDLRTQFRERYGTSTEPFVNKQFVEMLQNKPVTKEMKLQLMHAIAQEYNIEWDAKSLEQKLFRPPPQRQDQHGPGSVGNAVDESKNTSDGIDKQQSSSEDEVFSVSRRDSTGRDIVLLASSSSGRSVSDDEIDDRKQSSTRFVPPPYVKPGFQKEERKMDDSPKPTHKVAAKGGDKTPRSVRTRHSRQPSSDENFAKVERPLRPPPGREKVGNAENDKGQEDEEEKMMDNLLMHYSGKKESWHETTKPRPFLKPPPSWNKLNDTGEAKKARSELLVPSGRGASLDAEAPNEATRRHTRSVSLQPEALSRHVHPNLPDYDELAARVAALKER